MIDVNLINGIALALREMRLYSMYIRRHLIFKGMTKPIETPPRGDQVCLSQGSGSPDCPHVGRASPDGKRRNL